MTEAVLIFAAQRVAIAAHQQPGLKVWARFVTS
jgi:hypothetical protein